MGVYLFISLFMGVIGLIVGAKRGREGAGFGLGLFLGLIGILIVMALEPRAGSDIANRRALRDRMDGDGWWDD